MNSTFRSWVPELRPLIVVTFALFLITAVVYPLAVTGVAQVVFPRQANGSLLKVNGEAVGSSLIGQRFTEAYYFHGRPSAAGDGYDAASSSGSNLGPTSDKLLNGIEGEDSFDGIAQRVQAFREENGLPSDAEVPADAVTASASGLDPHVSPATARLQVERVAAARHADPEAIRKLVERHVEDAFLGFIGEPRVNVLKLNIALDKAFPLEK
ncbi:MAG: K(+)-transporting ATPase subunit C [Dehalococcoidia bacterium]